MEIGNLFLGRFLVLVFCCLLVSLVVDVTFDDLIKIWLSTTFIVEAEN